MNKISLMNIMESLSAESMEEAEASLHEWFVELAKKAHGNITGAVAEADQEMVDYSTTTTEVIEAEMPDENLIQAATKARNDSKEGYVQHVDMDPSDGRCSVSDWMSDDTVVSYSNGRCIGGNDPLPEDMPSAEPDVASDVDVDSMEFVPEPTFESLMAELTEAFTGLETCSDKLQNVEGAQVGEEGKIPVNKKSTLPNHKAADRVGGKAVEIKSNGHKGHDLEKAPKTASAPVSTKNSEPDMAEVKADKSALLNKDQGKINTTSPISGKGAKGLK